MDSRHSDRFNHDDQAARYDADVADESNPIRAGYAATLRWVIEAADVGADDRVLELGSGTGMLTAMIPPCAALACVDVSRGMEAIARERVGPRSERKFIHADALGVFEQDLGPLDVILSTYAIHHLTDDEKLRLFRHAWDSLRPGGRAVFGDLMLDRRADRDPAIERFRAAGDEGAAAAIEEEFFWWMDEAQAALEGLGFAVETRRFSELSAGIVARRP